MGTNYLSGSDKSVIIVRFIRGEKFENLDSNGFR